MQQCFQLKCSSAIHAFEEQQRQHSPLSLGRGESKAVLTLIGSGVYREVQTRNQLVKQTTSLIMQICLLRKFSLDWHVCCQTPSLLSLLSPTLNRVLSAVDVSLASEEWRNSKQFSSDSCLMHDSSFASFSLFVLRLRKASEPEKKVRLRWERFREAKESSCRHFEMFFLLWYVNREKVFCGSMADSVTINSNVSYIQFYASHASALATTFEILYTGYREKIGKGEWMDLTANVPWIEVLVLVLIESCKEGEFDCDDQTCIHESLMCNGHKNCRFEADETQKTAECDVSPKTIQLPIDLTDFHSHPGTQTKTRRRRRRREQRQHDDHPVRVRCDDGHPVCGVSRELHAENHPRP